MKSNSLAQNVPLIPIFKALCDRPAAAGRLYVQANSNWSERRREGGERTQSCKSLEIDCSMNIKSKVYRNKKRLYIIISQLNRCHRKLLSSVEKASLMMTLLTCLQVLAFGNVNLIADHLPLSSFAAGGGGVRLLRGRPVGGALAPPDRGRGGPPHLVPVKRQRKKRLFLY